MNVDELVKLMLATGFTFSLVGISLQIMRLIGKFSDSIQDLRLTFQNVSRASDMFLDDYDRAREVFHKLLDFVEALQANVIEPIKGVLGLVSLVGNRVAKSSDKEQDSKPANN